MIVLLFCQRNMKSEEEVCYIVSHPKKNERYTTNRKPPDIKCFLFFVSKWCQYKTVYLIIVDS